MDSTNNGTTTLRKAYDLLKSESASLAFSLQEFENILDCSSCSNKEYLMLNEFMLVLRAMEVQLTSTLFTSNCATASDRVKGGNNDESPAAKKAKHDSWSREDRQAVVRRLSRVRELQIAVSQDLRLERYSQVPRLARICEIYKLSQGEARLLSTMAVLATMETQVARCAVSEEDATRRSYQICRFAGVSEVDFEAFIDSGREHCKDNIIQVTDDEYQQNALPAVRINKICTKLIRGDDNFTEEELIKLAWTKLESVLAAEGIKTGISSKGLATPESKKHAPENNMEEENDTCDERVGAIGPSPTSVLSQDKEFETASLISTPYAAEVGELQYLGELFEVIALQIRLATARTKAQVKAATEGTNQSRILFVGQEDGNGNARAQARELEAKVKVAEQKLANRTNATPIKPRLITMAHKLGLDEYEVRVVALLVGRVLSPVIKNLMDSWEAGTGSGMQRLDDSTTVGACLAIFSPNFADQVAKRSKFYKSSRLLSKGILRINAPRWHAQGSNDLTESRVELDRRVLDHLVGLDSEISEIFESSELITPKAKFCHVVLPDNVKEQLITMVEAYSTLSEHKDKLMLDEVDLLSWVTLILIFRQYRTEEDLLSY
uniref:Winged helix domain-containing protein n=1 Tax=Aureoumbra lagunensis TaxID=44058 RepID=A0A7S3NKP4_9STRA